MKRFIALLMLAPLLIGCSTVQKARFYEDTQELNEDGSVRSSSHIEWEHSARGGPLTDIDELKSDSEMVINSDGSSAVRQGNIATGVSTANQLEAFLAGADAVKAIGVSQATDEGLARENEELRATNSLLHDVIDTLEARIEELEAEDEIVDEARVRTDNQAEHERIRAIVESGNQVFDMPREWDNEGAITFSTERK